MTSIYLPSPRFPSKCVIAELFVTRNESLDNPPHFDNYSHGAGGVYVMHGDRLN